MWSLETPVACKLGWLVETATVIRSLHPRYPPTDMPFQDRVSGYRHLIANSKQTLYDFFRHFEPNQRHGHTMKVCNTPLSQSWWPSCSDVPRNRFHSIWCRSGIRGWPNPRATRFISCGLPVTSRYVIFTPSLARGLQRHTYPRSSPHKLRSFSVMSIAQNHADSLPPYWRFLNSRRCTFSYQMIPDYTSTKLRNSSFATFRRSFFPLLRPFTCSSALSGYVFNFRKLIRCL